MFEMTMYEHPPEGEILRGLKITVNDSDQVGLAFISECHRPPTSVCMVSEFLRGTQSRWWVGR